MFTNIAKEILFGRFSIFCRKSASELLDKRIGLFSYGSGLAASMFSIRVTESVAVEQSGKFTLAGLASGLSDIPARLECRQRMTPESFTAVLQRREQTHMLGECLLRLDDKLLLDSRALIAAPSTLEVLYLDGMRCWLWTIIFECMFTINP